MTSVRVIQVLVADDHPVVCAGVSAMIATQPDMAVVAQAHNGRAAIDLSRQFRPDVVLMDLRMPEIGGVEAIREIRKQNLEIRVIVLTTYQGDADIRRALEAGAQAYLLKGMPHQELIEAIRRVHAGERYLPPPVMRSLEACPPEPGLSRRELSVLSLIVKGMGNRQIAGALGITEGTVKWHINIILGRLNVTDRTQAAVAALQRGIVEL